MIYILGKINDYVHYKIYEKYPITEYVVGMVNSFHDAITIMSMCPWEFNLPEIVKLFMSRYVRLVIGTATTGVLWLLYGKGIATELFDVITMPGWMFPFCIWGAAEIFHKVLAEAWSIYE